jgi:hypothetical protein
MNLARRAFFHRSSSAREPSAGKIAPQAIVANITGPTTGARTPGHRSIGWAYGPQDLEA